MREVRWSERHSNSVTGLYLVSGFFFLAAMQRAYIAMIGGHGLDVGHADDEFVIIFGAERVHAFCAGAQGIKVIVVFSLLVHV